MKKFTLAAIFFTTCIDSLSWSIVFPIFAPFFLNMENGLFSPLISVETRTTVLGFFLMAFSLGQFFGAPFVGTYADLRGRKRALLLTVFMTFLGLALSAWSVQKENLYLLFVGRLITGIFAANLTVCLTCITDLSEEEKERVKYFGHLSVIVGLSFIFGAFLGGKFSDPTIHASFTPQLPLWIATGLTLINFLFVLFGFKETSLEKKSGEFTFSTFLRNIKEVLKTKKIRSIYFVYFLFLFAWTMVFQFTPVMMVRNFYFTSSNIGDLALFMGVCWAIGSGYLSKLFLGFFSSTKILETALLVFTIVCALLVISVEIYAVLGMVAICIVIGGLAWPLCNGLISSAAPHEMQGKVLGVSQSVQSLAMAMAPGIGGLAYQAFEGFPFLVGAVASLSAGIIYYSLKEA